MAVAGAVCGEGGVLTTADTPFATPLSALYNIPPDGFGNDGV